MKKGMMFLVALLVLGLAAVAMAETRIEVKGSTTVFPIMQKAVEAYMAKNPDVKISVAGGGSSNGIKALIDGSTDLAMASRVMKDSEIELAKSKGITPVKTVVALDAVAPMVNPANSVDALTVQQLSDIFSGKVKNWSEVGGAEGPIAVVSRDSSSGTYETWQELVLGKEKVAPTALMQASSGAVLETVGKNKYAISYDGLGYINNSVKALKVNGVMPSAATVRDKTYPIARELQVYTNGEPSAELKKFVDFLLGAEGQKIVEEVGFIPLK